MLHILLVLAAVPTLTGTMTLDDGDGGVAARGTFTLTYNADANADASNPDAPPRDAGFPPDALPSIDAGPPSSGCGRTPPTQGQHTIVVGGVTRSYYLALLPNYSQTRPQALVFGWHGSSWLGASFRPSIPVESFAQAAGADAVFVYPDGLGNPTGWGGTSDLPFYDALRAELEATICIDTSRVYSYGRSFGAYMANILACARGGGIRATAILSGWGPSAPCAKESVWIWHGTQDPTVGVSQGRASRDTWNTVDVTSPGAPYAGPPSYCTRYAGPNDVVYCEDPNGVHWHPDGAEGFVWNWFRAHGAQGGAPPPPPADAGFAPDAAPNPDASVTTGARSLGTNLDTIVYWSTVPVFGNALKQSSRWFTGSGPATADNPPLAQDANGNITALSSGQIAKALLFSGGGHPSGDYQLLWDGVATWAVTQGATIVSTTPGRVVIRVAAGSTAQMELDLTSVGSPPPTNVRLMLPGLADGTEFNPAYLTSLAAAGYTTLRFMNWMRASDDTLGGGSQPPVFTAANRSLPSNIRYSTTVGVPLEVIADTANVLGRDAWVNLHHTADDTYVRTAAQVMCGRLNPALKVYVAHSNEVWNGIFPQYNYASQHGLAAGLSTDPFLAGQFWHTQRTAQMVAIWKAECGPTRVVAVLESQAANDWLSRQMLAFAQGRSLSGFDILAVAPYFGGDITPGEATSVDAVFNLITSRSMGRAVGWMQAQKVVANAYALQLGAYEGGQHLTSFNQSAAAEAVFRAAQTDARMGPAYDTYRQAWVAAGGGLFMHFLDVGSWSAAGGYWGARQTLNESCASSVKCAALLRWP